MNGIFDRLGEFKERLREIDEDLSDPSVLSDVPKYRDLLKERAKLEEIVRVYDDYERTQEELSEARELLRVETDRDMISFLKSEIN